MRRHSDSGRKCLKVSVIKGMITVALLFLVSEGIRQSGTLGQVIKKTASAGEDDGV